MAKVGAKRAAELTGKSKSTIQRAMNSGKISFEKDANGRRVIDVSELERAFGLVQSSPSTTHVAAQDELKRASDLLEIERLRMRVKNLEDQLRVKEDQVDDLRSQRDQWQKQAQQVLITSQYSQRQAEEYKAEIRERDRKEQAKRQKLLKERMSKAKSQTEAQKKVAQKSSHKPQSSAIQQKTDAANEGKVKSNTAAGASESEQNSFWSSFKKRISA